MPYYVLLCVEAKNDRGEEKVLELAFDFGTEDRYEMIHEGDDGFDNLYGYFNRQFPDWSPEEVIEPVRRLYEKPEGCISYLKSRT